MAKGGAPKYSVASSTTSWTMAIGKGGGGGYSTSAGKKPAGTGFAAAFDSDSD